MRDVLLSVLIMMNEGGFGLALEMFHVHDESGVQQATLEVREVGDGGSTLLVHLASSPSSMAQGEPVAFFNPNGKEDERVTAELLEVVRNIGGQRQCSEVLVAAAPEEQAPALLEPAVVHLSLSPSLTPAAEPPAAAVVDVIPAGTHTFPETENMLKQALAADVAAAVPATNTITFDLAETMNPLRKPYYGYQLHLRKTTENSVVGGALGGKKKSTFTLYQITQSRLGILKMITRPLQVILPTCLKKPLEKALVKQFNLDADHRITITFDGSQGSVTTQFPDIGLADAAEFRDQYVDFLKTVIAMLPTEYRAGPNDVVRLDVSGDESYHVACESPELAECPNRRSWRSVGIGGAAIPDLSSVEGGTGTRVFLLSGEGVCRPEAGSPLPGKQKHPCSGRPDAPVSRLRKRSGFWFIIILAPIITPVCSQELSRDGQRSPVSHVNSVSSSGALVGENPWSSIELKWFFVSATRAKRPDVPLYASPLLCFPGRGFVVRRPHSDSGRIADASVSRLAVGVLVHAVVMPRFMLQYGFAQIARQDQIPILGFPPVGRTAQKAHPATPSRRLATRARLYGQPQRFLPAHWRHQDLCDRTEKDR